jgi:adenylate cyclase
VERRLAAVVAADVAGYSRLMVTTMKERWPGLKQSEAPLSSLRSVPIVAALSRRSATAFWSSSPARSMRHAVPLRSSAAWLRKNDGIAPDKRIEFRVGIHVGDIIIDDNDIFGDGVNIAARLENIADPGGICISDDAYRQIRSKVDMTFEDMGELTLKNITEPIRAWRLKIGSEASAARHSAPAELHQVRPLSGKPSVAVLPFQNMSGDPEQKYFADGSQKMFLPHYRKFKN